MVRSRTLCALFSYFLSTAVCAQNTIGLDEIAQLPNLGSGNADHATVAVNKEGDVLLVWHTRVDISGFSTRQIEAAFLANQGTGSWSVPEIADLYLLGDPTAAVMGALDDCWKPDVAAVGKNFIVTWPRSAFSGGDARLETVLFEVPVSGTPIVHQVSPGVGHPVVSGINSGIAGVMPDLAHMGGFAGFKNQAVIAYTEQSQHQGAHYEFDVKIAHVQYAGPTPTVDGPYLIASGVPEDDFLTGGPNGGRILPDVLEKDDDSLVLVFDQYAQATHYGTPTAEGYINVYEISYSPGTQPLVTATLQLYASDPVLWQRRANLATSLLDQDDSVSLSWYEYPDGGLQAGDIDCHFVELSFTGGTIQATDLQFSNDVGYGDGFPVPLHAKNLRAGLCHSELPSNIVEIRAWAHTPPVSPYVLNTQGIRPWRPAVGLLEFGYGGAGSRLVPLSYEAEVPSLGGVTRIFVVLTLI